MKTTYLSRIFKILVLVICIITVFSNLAVMAYKVTEKFDGNISSIGDSQTKVKKVIGTVLDIVRFVGIGIALIILMYIGVKFMLAAPSEKANIKQYSINYVIGAAILIGASGILTIIKDFAQKATNQG